MKTGTVFDTSLFLLAAILHFTLSKECSDLNTTVWNVQVNVQRTVRLPPCSQNEVRLTNISNSISVSYVILQVHSQYRQFNVSLTKSYQHDKTVTGNDRGVLTLLKKGQTEVRWFVNSTYEFDVSVILLAVAYNDHAPVAGGCSVEFNLEQDPNLHLNYNTYKTNVYFQFAHIPYKREQKDMPPCTFPTSVDYVVYQYYLADYDLTMEAYNEAIIKMTTVQSVRKTATKVIEVSFKKKTSVSFASNQGQGAIYNVLVVQHGTNGTVTSAAYVPISTYSCSFTAKVDSCQAITSVVTQVLCTFAGLIGLFVCFAGHRFFKTEMFIFGCIPSMLISFIVLTITTEASHTERVNISAVIGVVGGSAWLTFWWCRGIAVISVLLVGLSLGYLTASIVFFTPLGNLEIWENNMTYGLTFACICLVVPVFLLYFTKTLNVISCAVIGSYGLIVALNYYIKASLSHIILNSIKRAVISDFGQLKVETPFYTKDIILTVAWLLLAISGSVCQFYTERHKPEFPPCPKTERKLRFRQAAQLGSECQPLIINDN